MKTIFIEPPFPPGLWVARDQAGKFGTLSSSQDALFPPLDFAYAGAILEKNGFEFEIIDAPALNLDWKGLLHKVSKIRDPSFIIVNTSAITLPYDLIIINAIKKRKQDSVIGVTGSLLSVWPEMAMKNPSIDIVIQSEVEFVILELLKALENDRLKDVNGITYRDDDGSIVRNPKRQWDLNLDELPFPAYHRLPVKRYHYDRLPRRPFITMLTSRGCPYNCIYCPYPIAYGNLWRARSCENVIEELQYVVDKFGVKSVLFKDQVFTFDMKRAEEICDRILEHKLNIQWICETRVDKLSEKLLLKMKKAGCTELHLGVESGDPEILSAIGKRGVKIDTIKRVFKAAKNVGIKTVAFFIIGLPNETRHSIWKSYKLAIGLNADHVQFTIITPYPGTKLYEIAERNNWILCRDPSEYNLRNVVMRTDKLSGEDLIQAKKHIDNCLKAQGVYAQEILKPPLLASLVKKVLSTIARKAERQFRIWVEEEEP
ncbi:MAG: radical SAM protein [Candidatus Aenigmatarchaeota archaeon]